MDDPIVGLDSLPHDVLDLIITRLPFSDRLTFRQLSRKCLSASIIQFIRISDVSTLQSVFSKVALANIVHVEVPVLTIAFFRTFKDTACLQSLTVQTVQPLKSTESCLEIPSLPSVRSFEIRYLSANYAPSYWYLPLFSSLHSLTIDFDTAFFPTHSVSPHLAAHIGVPYSVLPLPSLSSICDELASYQLPIECFSWTFVSQRHDEIWDDSLKNLLRSLSNLTDLSLKNAAEDPYDRFKYNISDFLRVLQRPVRRLCFSVALGVGIDSLLDSEIDMAQLETFSGTHSDFPPPTFHARAPKLREYRSPIEDNTILTPSPWFAQWTCLNDWSVNTLLGGIRHFHSLREIQLNLWPDVDLLQQLPHLMSLCIASSLIYGQEPAVFETDWCSLRQLYWGGFTQRQILPLEVLEKRPAGISSFSMILDDNAQPTRIPDYPLQNMVLSIEFEYMSPTWFLANWREFPSLQTLDLTATGDRLGPYQDLLRKCPNLRTVTLRFVLTENAKIRWNLLGAELPSLTSLSIHTNAADITTPTISNRDIRFFKSLPSLRHLLLDCLSACAKHKLPGTIDDRQFRRFSRGEFAHLHSLSFIGYGVRESFVRSLISACPTTALVLRIWHIDEASDLSIQTKDEATAWQGYEQLMLEHTNVIITPCYLSSLISLPTTSQETGNKRKLSECDDDM